MHTFLPPPLSSMLALQDPFQADMDVLGSRYPPPFIISCSLNCQFGEVKEKDPWRFYDKKELCPSPTKTWLWLR